jgi:DNA-binding transcriptional LysR family regulator
MALTLRQIDAFRAVMLLGTLTEAAQHLGISQPAISRLIADLEDEIGFKLFDRSGRRVVPTSEAQMLVDEVRRALVGLDQIKETALEIGRLRYSRLRLITVHSIASTIVTDLIEAFSRDYPETLISLEVQPADAAVEWVVSQQCDLGLVSAAPESPALASRPVLIGATECIIPLGHALADRQRIVPSDLEGESFVSFRPDSILRARIDQIFQREGVDRVLRYEARTVEAVCSLVAAGLGVSIVGPLGSHSRHLAGHRFLVKPFEPSPDIELSLIWSTHRPLPVVAQKFLDVANHYFRN